ncbi:MAG: hypothetical protein F6K41_29235 [Symploca sp. SIO3E6]|nr:hypothetical protein [Caldora sp. SIO3E6]
MVELVKAEGRRQEAGGRRLGKIFHHQVIKLGVLLLPVAYSLFPIPYPQEMLN